ncbi:hypothetical protein D9758_010615 [Tetrapyrgos nigripes]|uniref:Uncharacterized protein n=1 Tax=Tetrapyrgos nigripes TaxID=182062 RepID=A0A8H5D5Z1_9AGAR|nr:hypothetical protein D9758_010615 [Tetrapyrgos nigripes]
MYLSFMIPSSSSSDAKVSRRLSNHAGGNANTNNGSRRTIPLSFSSPGSGLGSGSGADGQQGHGNEKDGSGGGGGGGDLVFMGYKHPIRHYHTMLHIIEEDFGQGLLMLFVQKNALSLRSLALRIQSMSLCVKIWRDGGFEADYDAESLDEKSGTGKGGNLMGMRRWLS